MQNPVIFPPSVAAYADECEAVLSFLKEGPISQDEFDQRSRAWRWDPTRKADAQHYTPGTIIPPWRGDLLLAITQEMMRAGLIEAYRRKKLIWYKWKGEGAGAPSVVT